MANDAERKYALYAMPLTAENILAAANERFSRATPTPEPGYVLVYTDGDQPNGSREITAEQADLLTAADARWLMDCGAALSAEALEKHKTEIFKGLSEDLENLERELQRAKEKIEQRGE